MDLKLSRKRVIETLDQINVLLGKDNVKKFNYALIRNKQRLESACKLIFKSIDKMERVRTETCIKFCEKDKDGKPVVVNSQYQGLQKGTDKEFDIFMENYTEKRTKYLDEEIELKDIYTIDEVYVPQVVNGVAYEAILPFIKPEIKKS